MTTPSSKLLNLKTPSAIGGVKAAERIGVLAEHKSFLTGLSIERLNLLRNIVRQVYLKNFPKGREISNYEVDRMIEAKGGDLMRRMEETSYKTGAAVVFGDK